MLWANTFITTIVVKSGKKQNLPILNIFKGIYWMKFISAKKLI